MASAPAFPSGDRGKCFVIALTLAFLASICLHELNVIDVFSASYRRDGFCISNKDGGLFTQGHALSFYTDSTLALMLLGLASSGARRGWRVEALAPLRKNAASLFAHGLGHAILGAIDSTPEGHKTVVFEELSGCMRLLTFVAFLPVWYGFMRDRRRSTSTALCFASVHNGLQVFVLPSRFFFTHVLLAVLLNSACRKLAMPTSDKDIHYALEAWLVDVPILLMSFVEALACDAFLVGIGGHVWFDAVVPVGFTAYYAVVRVREQQERERVGEAKKIDNAPPSVVRNASGSAGTATACPRASPSHPCATPPCATPVAVARQCSPSVLWRAFATGA